MRQRRFLPEFITAFPDRHGKTRYRFRRKGYPSRYINAPLGSPAFLEAYAACMALASAPELPIGAGRIAEGTIADLVTRFYRRSAWANMTPGAQDHDRRIINRFRDEHGPKRVAALTYEHVDAILAAKAGTPTAANKLRKKLKQLMTFAVAIDMIVKDPMTQTKPFKVRSGGYHTWTEEEIAQYQQRHELGTKARLALELLLWTGQRLGDAILMGRQQIQRGRIRVIQEKTGADLWIPVAPQLVKAITAMSVHNHLNYIVTEYGAPFTRKGFGNWFRDQCDAAGLPQCSAHGLRKAMARRLAELNLSHELIKSITGHKTDAEVSRYTADANQQALADTAMARLAEWEMSNPPVRLDINADKSDVNQ
tara:strand:+ start:8663 stop:9760 length:1098 start_codon:yes stop_codon:yes gene_type:complete